MRHGSRSLYITSGQHIAPLDGLRGLAILLVLLFHFTRREMPFFRLGWVGVDLFFVLSGFLITGILVDTRERAGYFRNFIVRRALRIFPLYYFSLAVFSVVCIVVASDDLLDLLGCKSYWQNYWWYWSYMGNWLVAKKGAWPDTAMLNHFWSLAIEEQFYLIWPFVVWATTNKKLIWVCAGLAVAALCYRIVIVSSGGNPIAAYVTTPARVDALAIGSMIAVAIRRDDYGRLLSRLAFPVFIGGLCALLSIVVITKSMDNLHPAYATVGYTINALLFGGLLIICLSRIGSVEKIFNHPVMQYLGKYSYSLYIFHVPVHYLLASIITVSGPLKFVIVFFGSILICVMVSQVTWFAIERPFIKLKRFFN